MSRAEVGASHRDIVRILGVPIDRITMKQSLAKIDEFVRSESSHLIVTADANGVMLANIDPAFNDLVETADLVTPDGSGIIWAAKKCGTPLPEKVSGVDMVGLVCALSADKGYRIYFLGSAPGIAELAADKLRLAHPGCNIVGTRHGYFPAESDEVIAHEVAESRPDILFVAMGMPRQEQFFRATEHIIGAKVGIGIGGSLDVYSGKAKRAPKLIQNIRLEWLWRVILKPSKISKVKRLPKFVFLVLKQGKR